MISNTLEPNIRKHLVWRESGDLGLATALHVPRATPVRNLGVVICPPIGHEHVHTFRTLRTLADSLAEAGYPTARFEYRGTGNSFGEVADCRVGNWIADIDSQISGLETDFDLKNICLVGFRFGALLAAASIGNRKNVSLISWAEVKHPKSYVRELRALSRLSGYPPSENDDIECGGFVYSIGLLNDLRLIETRIDQATRPVTIFQLNVGDSDFSRENYDAMLLEPHYAQVPENTVRAIVEKVDSLATTSAGARTPVRLDYTTREVFELEEVCEELDWDKTLSIAGVRCKTVAGDAPKKRQVVIFPNAGSVHSMGPNRVYTQLARTLAKNGIDSFRFDLPNLGESVVLKADHENEPYLDDAPSVVHAVVDKCRRSWGYDSVIVAGLCSGSYNGFLATLMSSRAEISSLIMINPLTFHWEPGMPFRLGSSLGTTAYESKHYARAMFSRSSWLKLLTGKVDYGALISFSIRHSWKILRTTAKQTLDRLGISRPTDLAVRLKSIAAKDIRLVFVFSSRDPGHDLLREEALFAERRLKKSGKLEICKIDDADHTFSRAGHRHILQNEIVTLLRLNVNESGNDLAKPARK